MSVARSWAFQAKAVFGRWRSEEDGQDLIEYMLLGATIAFAGVIGFNFLSNAMETTYTSWDAAVQSDALVEVPDPTPTEE